MAAVAAPLSLFTYGGGISRHYCSSSSSSSSLPVRTTRWPNSLVTLAIETSCDDTAVAVLEKEREDEDAGGEEEASSDDGEWHRDDSTTPSPGRRRRRRRRPARARLLFEERITADNRAFGGIHPLTAAEAHMAAVAPLVQRALAALPAAEAPQAEAQAAAEAAPPRPDFVAVTRGPGMLSSLAAGLAVAKGLAVAWQVPLVGVHHMQAHALTPRLAHALALAQAGPGPGPDNGAASPAFPYLAFLVSGGHTLLVHARSATDHRVRAAAANMAVGDLLDKCARAILPPGAIAAAEAAAGRSLPYGALLEQFADGDAAAAAPAFHGAYQYPATRRDEMAPFVHAPAADGSRGWQLEAPLSRSARRALRFDFSGLNGAVQKLVGGGAAETDAEENAPWTVDERRVLARATMQLAFEHLASRLLMVLEDADGDGPPTCVVVAGGVASNGFLRRVLRSALDARGFGAVPLVAPPPRLCTDNAAMIAWAGMEMYEAGWQTDLRVLPVRRWSMDARAEDGGVLGPGSAYVRRV